MNGLGAFRCLADRCPDTCCSGWMIEIDEKSLEKYRNVSGSYHRILEERIDTDEGVFKQKENGDCCFLCENKLCDMYINLGEAALCDTCRLYPRHIEEFENVREMTLSISCPEVARLLMAEKGLLTMGEDTSVFSVDDYPEKECFEDYDRELYDILFDERIELTKIMQDRSKSYVERAQKSIAYAYELQEDLYSFDNSEIREYNIKLDSFETVKRLFGCLKELEHLKVDRELMLDRVAELLYGSDKKTDDREKHWLYIKADFEAYCAKNSIDLEIMREQLTVYYLYSYFCGAVYDDYVYAKVMGAVAHTILIGELWLAAWLENNRDISIEEMVRIVYEYARELENSNPNLIHMDEMMEEMM